MPVLPATVTPGIAALVPVPALTTPCIAVFSSSAVCLLITVDCSLGSIRLVSRPSGSTTLSQICGFISTPPLATVAATSAIWRGVASSRSWPIATRPMSIGSFAFSSVPPSKMPLTESWSEGRSICGLALNPKAFMYLNRVSSPTCWPSWAKKVLTESVRAVSRADRAEVLVEVVVQGGALDVEDPRGVDRRVGRDRAAVEPGRGGDDLEGRARRELALGGAVEQGPPRVLVELGQMLGHPVGVKRRVGGIDQDAARLRLDRDHGAGAGRGEVGEGDPLRGRVDAGDDVVALLLAAAQLVEDRDELGVVADQLVVVVLLELGVALLHEAVADRVPEQLPLGVAAHVAQPGAVPLVHGAGDHRPVGGEDAPAPDLLLLEQRPLVGALLLQRLGVEHGPVAGEADEDGKEEDDEPKELGDLGVHGPFG